jgi:hypothetical protein
MSGNQQTLTGGAVDDVFRILVARFDGLKIERLQVRNPNDDNNLWYLTLASSDIELQMDAQSERGAAISVGISRKPIPGAGCR